MMYLDKRDNRDIIEYIQRRYFIKGSACAFLSLGVLIFFYVYGYSYFAVRMGDVGAVVITLVCLGLPFFALGIHKEIFDRSWEGEIVSMKSHLVNKSGAANRVAVSIHEYICLAVNTGNDIVTVDRPVSYLSRFRKGDRLRHIKGTKYLQSCRPSGVRDCVMCGCIVRESGNECPHCGFSLVKFELPEDAS